MRTKFVKSGTEKCQMASLVLPLTTCGKYLFPSIETFLQSIPIPRRRSITTFKLFDCDALRENTYTPTFFKPCHKNNLSNLSYRPPHTDLGMLNQCAKTKSNDLKRNICISCKVRDLGNYLVQPIQYMQSL